MKDFFDRVEWPYLTTYLGVENQEFIQMKVDEVYEEQYETRVNESEVNTIIEDWRNKDNSIYNEVCQLVESLNLKGFKMSNVNGLNEDVGDIQHQEPNKSNQDDGHILHNNSGEDLSLGVEVSNENRRTPISPKLDLPKLTKTQRRMSLDLMHTAPSASPQLSSHILELNKKRPNLSKPASATTTNVNVITKTDMNTNANQKEETASNSSRFQNFLRKIKLKITRDVGEIAPVQKSTLIVQLDDTLKGKAENIMDDFRKTYTKEGRDKNPYKSTALKKARRLSLVGENLPLYIRQQLDVNNSNSNRVLDNSSSQIDSVSSRSILKRQSRMHNILENSQSLYSQSKDLSLMGSGIKQDDDNMPNTSEIERVNENKNESENGSDDDKEYILPDLLARYYDSDTNEDDILLNINEIEDAFDFINVRSYDTYENMEDVEEEEEEEDCNEDDEYLFKI